MAKRFTDTDKWKRPWLRGLPTLAKLAWIYVLDNCDNCGVWPADFSLMSFQLGVDISREDFEGWFEGKASPLEADKFFIPSFIEFQYGDLNPDNNAHKGVIKFLTKLGANKALMSPSRGAQDKNKNKDQIKDQEKEEGECEGEILNPLPPSVFPGNPNLAAQVSDIGQVWVETLVHFKQGRTLMPHEELAIGRAVQRYGLDPVRYALTGARYEPTSDKFNPGKWLQLKRVLDPDNFDRMVGYGVAHAHKTAEGQAS